MNDGQPSQSYNESANPNVGTEIPKHDSTRTPQPTPSPSEKEKSDGLSRALLGGLIGGTLGSLAGIWAGKRLAQSFNHTTKGLGNAAKTIGEGRVCSIQPKVWEMQLKQ